MKRHKETIQTLLERFQLHLENDPDRISVSKVQVHKNAFEAIGITYKKLETRAKLFAHTLQKTYHLNENDRILLCLSDPHSFLISALGSMMAGYIVVPLPSLSGFGVPDEFLTRIQSVIKDCEPKLILTENLSIWKRHMDCLKLEVPVGEFKELSIKAEEDLTKPETLFTSPSGCETAFIQYTSGSTGHPKGVVITHQNLATNLYYMGSVSKVNPKHDRLLSWLPLYHDMGLVGNLLFPLYWKIPSFVLSPLSFVTRPVSWLKALDFFKATYAVAPTFAYTISFRKIPDWELEGLDLSHWRLAFIGAEPIDADTAQGFIRRFSKYGFKSTSFYPVYGMAEATLALAFPPCGRETYYDTISRTTLAKEGRAISSAPSAPHSISFVSVGQILPNHGLKIRDPNSLLDLPERHVGEIIVSGDSVSPAYFNKKDLKPTPRTELRTGDLGYVANGELYIVDRLKDLIIISGQNFIPSDIERRLADIKGLRAGRIVAFSTPDPEGGELLQIVAEFQIGAWRQLETLKDQITHVLNDRFGIQPDQIVLTTPGSLPKTSSGKVKRRKCRDLFTEGKFQQKIGMKVILRIKFLDLWRRLLVAYSNSL